MSADRITLKLWLHRDETDAWLVSLGGIGAGVWLPKSEITLEPDHPVPVLGPVGPVEISMPIWLADKRSLRVTTGPEQGSLF